MPVRRVRALDPNKSACDAIHGATQDEIRQQRQERRCKKQFQGIDEPMRNELINRIENCGNEKRSANVFPSSIKQLPPVRGLCEPRPKISRSSIPGILDASAKRQYGRNSGLDDEPKVECTLRAGEKVIPSAYDHID
jgi:hypothetical protein